MATMKSGIFICLLCCVAVFGQNFQVCFTRDKVKGYCLFPFVCSNAGPDRIKSASQDPRNCEPELICCPGNLNTPFIPQPVTQKVFINTGQKYTTQNNRPGRPNILFPKPVTGSRQTLNDRITTTARPGVPAVFGPVPEKSDFDTGQKRRTNSGITGVLPSSIDRNRRQIIIPDKCSVDFHILRIFGGVETTIGEFPWMALLEYESGRGLKLRCSGSLISNWHVLTAAHCVHDWELQRLGLTLRSVRLGEWNIRTNPDCSEESAYPATDQTQRCASKYVSILIQRVFIHPFFETTSFSKQNDIALLQLKEPVQFSEYVRPICLPKTGKIASWATVSGWGRTEKALGSEKLLKVDLPFVDKPLCEPFYKKKNIELGPRQICFGEEGKDSCAGDSGGPLVQIDESNPLQPSISVIGIVSLGPLDCGSAESSGVYTKIYDYLPWIYDQIRSMNESGFGFGAGFRSNQPLKVDGNVKLTFPEN